MTQTHKYVDIAFHRRSCGDFRKVRFDENRLGVRLLGHVPKSMRLVVIYAWPEHLPGSNQPCILCGTYRFAECLRRFWQKQLQLHQLRPRRSHEGYVSMHTELCCTCNLPFAS
jgi:hypothetical protein